MQDDGLGDWRIQAATRLAKDLPAAYPGGPSHKAGTPVHLTTSTRDSKQHSLSFVTPSAAALALSIAMKASVQAKELYGKLKLDDALTPEGKSKLISFGNVGPLFDYFEYYMIAVTFSFQALETYCNHVIANELKGTFNLQRKDEPKTFTPIELEREATTEEKLVNVLPSIFGIKSPKGKKVWQNFVKMKKARNSTIHLKSKDQYPKQDLAGVIDRDALFYQFLNNDPTDLPKAAVAMIRYFASVKEIPRWLLDPMEFLGKEK